MCVDGVVATTAAAVGDCIGAILPYRTPNHIGDREKETDRQRKTIRPVVRARKRRIFTPSVRLQQFRFLLSRLLNVLRSTTLQTHVQTRVQQVLVNE